MTSTTTPAAPARSRLRSRALVVLAAVAAPAVVWLVATVLLGLDLAAATGSGPAAPVGLPAVLAAAALGALAGWGLLALLERFLRRGLAVWTAVSVVVLLVSVVPLLLPGDTTPASRVALALMHLAVAGVLVPGLRATGARARAVTER